MPNLRGTVGPDGYHAPDDVTIYWWHPSSNEVITKRLNPNVPITSHFDLIGRYGEGDQSLVGWQTYPAVSSESGGGEAYAIVAALYKQAGIPSPPSEQAWVDATFAELAQQGQLTVGCAGYGLVGLPVPPGCVEGGGGAKPGQPAITVLTSPRPGVVHVEWRSRPGNTRFKVEVSRDNFSTSRIVPGGDNATYSLDIAVGGGTEYTVTVTAYIGNTAGAPSIAKRVTVVGGTGEPPVEPPPPPPPPLDGPPHGSTPALSAESRDTMAALRDWVEAGKPLGPVRKRRVIALLDEVARLLPS
jgi:hypothetical protein